MSQFEHKLEPETLDEQPRQTSVDFFVSDPAPLICIECKWTEEGMGACGCPRGAAAISDCSKKVLEREAYWKAAREVLHLPERVEGRSRSALVRISVTQAISARRRVAPPRGTSAPGGTVVVISPLSPHPSRGVPAPTGTLRRTQSCTHGQNGRFNKESATGRNRRARCQRLPIRATGLVGSAADERFLSSSLTRATDPARAIAFVVAPADCAARSAPKLEIRYCVLASR